MFFVGYRTKTVAHKPDEVLVENLIFRFLNHAEKEKSARRPKLKSVRKLLRLSDTEYRIKETEYHF